MSNIIEEEEIPTEAEFYHLDEEEAYEEDEGIIVEED